MKKVIKIVLIAVCLIGVTFIIACSEVRHRAKTEYQLGAKQLKDKEYDKAFLYFRTVVDFYPAPFNKWYVMAEERIWELAAVYESKKEFRSAVRMHLYLMDRIINPAKPSGKWLEKCEKKIWDIAGQPSLNPGLSIELYKMIADWYYQTSLALGKDSAYYKGFEEKQKKAFEKTMPTIPAAPAAPARQS